MRLAYQHPKTSLANSAVYGRGPPVRPRPVIVPSDLGFAESEFPGRAGPQLDLRHSRTVGGPSSRWQGHDTPPPADHESGPRPTSAFRASLRLRASESARPGTRPEQPVRRSECRRRRRGTGPAAGAGTTRDS
eukprot:761803-Hanusia_phi.AAC.3